MNEQDLVAQAKQLSGWQKHRFLLMIGLAVATALSLVAISLGLYASSGTAQLDLSRPGYQSVRDQATKSDSFQGFSDTGPINMTTLEEFRQLYDERAEKATNFDSFGGNVMSNQELSIDSPE